MRLDRSPVLGFPKTLLLDRNQFFGAQNDYEESCGFYCSSNVKKQKNELNRFFAFLI